MRRMLLVLAVLGALIAAFLSACGEGDGNSGTEESLTKAQFVKQADGICAKYNRMGETQFQEVVESLNLDQAEPSKDVAAKGIAAVAIPILEEQIEELRALPAPEGEEQEVELILARQEQSLEKVEDEPLFRVSGNPYEELNKPAADYGLVECSL
jgi:hypothetical protein